MQKQKRTPTRTSINSGKSSCICGCGYSVQNHITGIGRGNMLSWLTWAVEITEHINGTPYLRLCVCACICIMCIWQSKYTITQFFLCLYFVSAYNSHFKCQLARTHQRTNARPFAPHTRLPTTTAISKQQCQRSHPALSCSATVLRTIAICSAFCGNSALSWVLFLCRICKQNPKYTQMCEYKQLWQLFCQTHSLRMPSTALIAHVFCRHFNMRSLFPASIASTLFVVLLQFFIDGYPWTSTLFFLLGTASFVRTPSAVSDLRFTTFFASWDT